MTDARISDHSAWAARGIWTKAYDCSLEEITTLRAQLADARAMLDDTTTLHRVIVDIREKSGVGSRPMLADLASAIADKLAAETARADMAEAERAAQIEAAATEIGNLGDDLAYFPALREHGLPKRAYDLSASMHTHDRTALDRYREKVLREAADTLKGQGYNTAVRQILALIWDGV